MAFIRAIKSKNGKTRYALVHNYRDKETGKVRQRVVKSYGSKRPGGKQKGLSPNLSETEYREHLRHLRGDAPMDAVLPLLTHMRRLSDFLDPGDVQAIQSSPPAIRLYVVDGLSTLHRKTIAMLDALGAPPVIVGDSRLTYQRPEA